MTMTTITPIIANKDFLDTLILVDKLKNMVAKQLTKSIVGIPNGALSPKFVTSFEASSLGLINKQLNKDGTEFKFTPEVIEHVLVHVPKQVIGTMPHYLNKDIEKPDALIEIPFNLINDTNIDHVKNIDGVGKFYTKSLSEIQFDLDDNMTISFTVRKYRNLYDSNGGYEDDDTLGVFMVTENIKGTTILTKDGYVTSAGELTRPIEKFFKLGITSKKGRSYAYKKLTGRV